MELRVSHDGKGEKRLTKCRKRGWHTSTAAGDPAPLRGAAHIPNRRAVRKRSRGEKKEEA